MRGILDAFQIVNDLAGSVLGGFHSELVFHNCWAAQRWVAVSMKLATVAASAAGLEASGKMAITRVPRVFPTPSPRHSVANIKFANAILEDLEVNCAPRSSVREYSVVHRGARLLESLRRE